MHIKDDDHIIFYFYYYQDLVFTAKKYEIKRDGKKSQIFIIDIIKDGAKYFLLLKK